MNNPGRKRGLVFSLLVFLAFSFFILFPASAASPANPIEIYIYGEKKDFEVYPLLIEGTTLLPMRAIFECLGAKVDWDPIIRQITANKGTTNILLTVDNTTAYINSVPQQLTRPPQTRGK
ncbi:MAG: copper amine oxidase N-terminal domain-containing protein [Bacillota bacterium]